ncbi:MAG TPA: hypothetical protein VKZ18_12075 [Polyangia bacterium]|nr:hypothetical protein [Polyangia bacterium]
MLIVGCRDHRPRAPASYLEPPSDRYRQDTPLPFAPVRGEVVPAQPCGPRHQGPCLLLGWEYYNGARGYAHSAWFMDTDGREYEFWFHAHPERGPAPEDRDPVRTALKDHLVTQDDFDRVVAASTALPLRVTLADVDHALALAAKSQTGPIETIRYPTCKDGGGSGLRAYVFAAEKNGAVPVVLEDVSCDFLLKGNASLAARELAQWVHRLRGTVEPYREPKVKQSGRRE